jgi:dipeptidyl aminopeptidase/acylaminoacyl peptidase
MSKSEFLEALLAVPNIRRYLVSPDGEWVAWSWVGLHPAAEVYVAATDGSTGPVRLTDTPENTQLVAWTPDSRAVIVGQDHQGDERVQLFKVEASLDYPGQMQPLTEASPDYFIRGGRLHPNGRWLFYTANYDFAAHQELEAFWLYRHDLITGERKVLARPARPGSDLVDLNHQGTHILYNRMDLHPNGEQIWLVDVEGREDREILNFGADKKVQACWTPDGQQVLFLAETGQYRRLGLWEKVSGALRWLIDDPQRNLESAFIPENAPGQVVVEEIKATSPRASWLEPATGREIKVPDLPGGLIPLAPAGKGPDWVGYYFSATQPADLVLFSPEAIGPDNFTSLTLLWEHTALQPAQLVPAQDFRWTAGDGLPVQGWLYRPQVGQPVHGTIIQVHGGPTAHSEDRYNAQVQYFVSAGFNVLTPNYRGSSGFNLAFQDAIKADGWGGREQSDIRDGITALIQAGIAQPGRVGVTGTSYGVYSSWCAITRYSPELVAAAVPICGMTDLVVDYETTRPDLRPYSEAMMGGRPDQQPARYLAASPINFVENIKGRLLIVQGLKDPNVSPQNLAVVVNALEQHNIPYEVLTFEDEGHGISKPHNQKTLYARMVRFFEQAFNQTTR